jgi:hypothetical protein
MQFRYKLPAHLTDQALALKEFANGGAQCHVRLKDGTVHSGLLVSNATAIIAMRGHRDLPFSVDLWPCCFRPTKTAHPWRAVTGSISMRGLLSISRQMRCRLGPNHSLNPDASPAALTRRPLGAG